MKKYLPYFIAFIFTTVALFSFYNHNKEMNFKFSGIVQKVTYESWNSYPTITVNHQHYSLEYIRWYDDAAIVEAGDSVIKNKGTVMMSLLKKTNK